MSNQLQSKTTEQISLEAFELYKSGKFNSQGSIVRYLLEIYPHIGKEKLRIALLKRVKRYKLKSNTPH